MTSSVTPEEVAPWVRKIPTGVAVQLKAIIAFASTVVGGAATLVTAEAGHLPTWASGVIGGAVSIVGYATTYVVPYLDRPTVEAAKGSGATPDPVSVEVDNGAPVVIDRGNESFAPPADDGDLVEPVEPVNSANDGELPVEAPPNDETPTPIGDEVLGRHEAPETPQ